MPGGTASPHPSRTAASWRPSATNVRATIGHLKRTDCRHVLDYHRSCATAGAKGLYHPFRDGDVYPLAYAQHIGPVPLLRQGPQSLVTRLGAQRRQRPETEGG